MPTKHENKKYGLPTSVGIAIGVAVVALIDQIIVPEVDINPIIYGIMLTAAFEAYPGILSRLK